MKMYLDSRNSKHDVITINPYSFYKLQEDRMWEGKDSLYWKWEVNTQVQEEGNELKFYVSTEDNNYYHIFKYIPHRFSVKSKKFKIKAGYYLCIGNIRGSLSRTAHSFATEQSSFLSWHEELFSLKTTSFQRTMFSRDMGFLQCSSRTFSGLAIFQFYLLYKIKTRMKYQRFTGMFHYRMLCKTKKTHKMKK